MSKRKSNSFQKSSNEGRSTTKSSIAMKSSTMSKGPYSSTNRSLCHELGKSFFEKNRTYKVFMMCETSEEYTQTVERLRFISKRTPESYIKVITYEDIFNICTNFPENDCFFFSEREALEEVYEECRMYVEADDEIPTDLLAKVLKYTILFYLYKGVFDAKSSLFKSRLGTDLLEGLKNTSMRNSAVNLNKSKLKSKEVDLSFDASQHFFSVLDSIEIQSAEIIFLITGFFNSELLIELINNEVNVAGIIEVSGMDTVLKDPEKKFQKPTASYQMTEDFVLKHFPNRVQSKFSLGTVASETKSEERSEFSDDQKCKTTVIYEFWNEIYEMFGGHPPLSCLKDSIHCKFIPPKIPREKDFSEKKICKLTLRAFLIFYKQIRNIYVKYENYINNTFVQTLSEKVEYRPVEASSSWMRRKSKIPSDCLNVYIYLEEMIEEITNSLQDEVCLKKDEEYKNREVKIEEESFYLATRGPVETESKVRRKRYTKSVVKYYKHACKNLPPNHNIHKEKIGFGPSKNMEYKCIPFTVHEKNYFEKSMRDYGRLFKKYFEKYTSCLRTHQVFQPWKLIREQTPIEMLYYKKDIDEWARKFNVLEEEVKETILVFLIDHITCTSFTKTKQKYHQLYSILFPPVVNKEIHINHPIDFKKSELGMARPLKKSNSFVWKEDLHPSVLMQHVVRCWMEYSCFDKLYSPFVDKYLFRFHYDVDNFGMNQIHFALPLRTPVCLRDFTKYILHEEGDWMDNFDEVLMSYNQKDDGIEAKENSNVGKCKR